MKTKLLFFLLIGLSIFAKDISIKIGEDGINKFIATVGTYSKTTRVDLKVTSFDVNWKIYDAKLNLNSKGSIFSAKIDVITDKKTRNGTIEGDARFSFDTKKQVLTVDVVNMKVRGLDIYDVIGFYKPKFELPIKVMQKEKIAIKEDGRITSYVIPNLYDDTVTVLDNSIIIEANINFVEDK